MRWPPKCDFLAGAADCCIRESGQWTASSRAGSSGNGVGSNGTFYATAVTNFNATLTTNGTIVYALYEAVTATTVWNQNTNYFYTYGAGWTGTGGSGGSGTGANLLFTWEPSLGVYSNATQNSSQITYLNTASNFWIFASYNKGVNYYDSSKAQFPAVWTDDYGIGSPVNTTPPLGSFVWIPTSIYTTNWYREIVGTANGTLVNLGGSQPALNAIGSVNALGFSLAGIPLQTIIQGASYSALWVTNCSGLATNFQGVVYNTWTGYYTNANGTILVPAGASVSSIDGTNFTTPISVLCSNLAAVASGQSLYSNSTNVLGYYSVSIGRDSMPTNQPLVTIYTAPFPSGLVTNNASATLNVTNGPNSTSMGTNSVTINGGSLFLKSTNGSTYFGGGQYYHQFFTTNEDMYILPQGNNAGRLYFGNASQMFYSLNFAGVTVFENLPPLTGPSLADNFCGLYNLNTGTPNLTAYYSVIIAGGFFANPPALNYASTASLIVTNPTATEVVEQIIGNNIQTGDLLDFWVNGARVASVASNAQFTIPTIVVTNLTLTTTSAAPVSTTPVVWFAFTNAGKLYKVGGCQ